MKRRKRYLYITILLIIFALYSAGCGEKENKDAVAEIAETADLAATETVEEEQRSKESQKTENGDVPDSSDTEEVIHVSSTEEFLDAIAPGVTIFVEPGYYNMSEYLEEVQTWKGYDWNAEHPYVKLEYCYDGVEVVIKNADDLTIMGDAESLAQTEIVVEPRYAAVLTFFNCCDLNLSFLTMGHTETGACSGNVLNFYGCKNITLSAMDLYGCGVYAIETGKGTGDLYVYNSTLRDCSDGSLFMIEGVGNFEFRDCILTGSYCGGYYGNSADSELHFYNCTFGEGETNTWFFWPDIYAIDCTWTEITQYPEYSAEEYYEGEEIPVLNPENMREVELDEEMLSDSVWIGYASVNPESGEMVYFPYEMPDDSFVTLRMELNSDKVGWIEYGEQLYEVTWECDENMAYLQTTEGWNIYLTLYTDAEDEFAPWWMLMEMNNELIWLY
ncbi:MAG: right-handed parallel beta-helix repeat-containing protein [Lachnospiraceae bacterium]|nr:right-handed parallel beta-helix repeat-containing protein [Lachnospiraceae bacterium]